MPTCHIDQKIQRMYTVKKNPTVRLTLEFGLLQLCYIAACGMNTAIKEDCPPLVGNKSDTNA